MNIAQNTKNRTVTIALTVILILSLVSGSLMGTAAAQDTSNLNIGPVDAPAEVSVNEAAEIESNAEIPSLPADWSAEVEFTLYEAKDGGANQLGTQDISVEDGESVNAAIEHEFENPGVKEVYFTVEGEITREGAVSSQTAKVKRTTQSVIIDVPGELDPDNIDISDIDAPSEVSPTEPVEIGSGAQIPDLPANWSADLEFVLYVNDEQAGTQQINIEDGESVDVAVEHEFQGTDEKEVYYNVEGEVTREGPVATQTKEIERTTETFTVDILAKTGLSQSTIEGAAFPVPDSLEDEVNSLKSDMKNNLLEDNTSRALSSIQEKLPEDYTSNAFVLANRDNIYVVLTSEEPMKGLATVEGFKFDKEISSQDLKLGVVAAKSTSFETSGTQRSVQDIVDNPDKNRLDLVKVNSHYRRASIRVDPESESANFPVTAGVLAENPRTASSMFKNIGSKARTLSESAAQREEGTAPSREQIETALGSPQQSRITTFSLENRYWMSSQATVDGIVLDPAGEASKYIREYTDIPLAEEGENRPTLYVVEADYNPEGVDDVSSIRSNADSLDGKVVEINARLFQGKISVEENLEEGTTAGCSPNNINTFPIPTGQGQPICKNLRTDELLHAGAAWSTVPQSRDDVLPVLGVSSNRQDQRITRQNGTYNIVGEVVSSDRIDENLPDGSVLLVYDMEQTGDIDEQEVRSEGREIIKTKRNEIATRLRSQLEQDDVKIDSDEFSSLENSEISGGESDSDSTAGGQDESTSSESDTEQQDESTSSESDTESSDQSSNSDGIGQIVSDIVSEVFRALGS